MTIALCGNPNSGKTTLFNALTGSSLHTGNYPGVTVEYTVSSLKGHPDIELADLPGTYSLSALSAEEALARDFLYARKADAILCVADATCPQRGLYLALQLAFLHLPMGLALTMTDELAASGGQADCIRLSRALGIPVFSVHAPSGRGLEELSAAFSHFPTPPEDVSAFPAFGPPAMEVLSARLFARVDQICASAFQSGASSPVQARSEAADRILLHPLLSLPIFLIVMALICYITYGPMGRLPVSILEKASAFLLDAARYLLQGAPPLLRSLVTDGVLTGLFGVLSFLPTLLILFFLLSLLEDSGYLARVAYACDRVLRRFGLSGRCMAPLLLGFGCTVPAILSTRTLSNRRERLMILCLLPYCSCSAKLPIYAIFFQVFFPKHPSLLMLLLYGLGVFFSLPAALVLNRLLPKEEQPFLLELPVYRLPSLRSTLRLVRLRTVSFLRCAFTTLLFASLILWALSTLQIGGVSLIQRLASLISPLFAPLGFDRWQAAAALITGLGAKEGILSAFSILLKAPTAYALQRALSQLFTPLSAFSFLLFVLLYSPCAASFSAARREMRSLKGALCLFLLQTLIAYMICLIVYNFFLCFG